MSMERRDFLRTAGGATAVGVAGGTASTAQAGAQSDGNKSDGGNKTGGKKSSGGPSGGGKKTVDMTDGLKFKPADITVPPGTTVVWKNVGSSGHTVTAYGDKIPKDATYFASGGFNSEEAARKGFQNGKGNIKGGASYQHTVETTGTYEYFCIPHEQAGMKGSIEVTKDATLGNGGGGGEEKPKEMGVPFRAHYVGIAAVLSIVITLMFTFFILKYGESPHASGGGG